MIQELWVFHVQCLEESCPAKGATLSFLIRMDYSDFWVQTPTKAQGAKENQTDLLDIVYSIAG